jgi:hypothetical protein
VDEEARLRNGPPDPSLRAHTTPPPPNTPSVQTLAILDILFGLVWGYSLLFLFIFIWLPICGYFGARLLKPGAAVRVGSLQRRVPTDPMPT